MIGNVLNIVLFVSESPRGVSHAMQLGLVSTSDALRHTDSMAGSMELATLLEKFTVVRI